LYISDINSPSINKFRKKTFGRITQIYYQFHVQYPHSTTTGEPT